MVTEPKACSASVDVTADAIRKTDQLIRPQTDERHPAVAVGGGGLIAGVAAQ